MTPTRLNLTDLPTAVLVHLAHRYVEVNEMATAKARHVALARFNGSCEVVHALGVGFTPAAVHQAVMAACERQGPRPGGYGTREASEAWASAVVADLRARGGVCVS